MAKAQELLDLVVDKVLTGGGRTLAAGLRAVLNPFIASVINKEDSPQYVETIATTGTNTYTAAYSTPITALTTGVIYKISFTNTNTAASTIAIDGLPVKAIKKADGTDVAAGDLKGIVALVYNGSVFQVLGGPGEATGGGGPAIANIATPYADITALLADQASQDAGKLYIVIDASDDSRVTTGSAIYAKGTTSTGTLVTDYIDISQQEWEADIYRVTPSGTITGSITGSHNLDVANKLIDTQQLIFTGNTLLALINSVDGGIYTINLFANTNTVITLYDAGGLDWFINGIARTTINLVGGVSQTFTIQRVSTDLECTLSTILASDSELQTQTTPTEDYKTVSRRGLIYFWNWLKGQAITWTGIHRFGITETTTVKVMDGSTPKTFLDVSATGVGRIGNGLLQLLFDKPILNWVHTKGSPALVEANEDGSHQTGPVMTSLTITNPTVIALLQDETNWNGNLFIGDLTGYEDYVEQGKYYFDEATNIRYDCQENDIITRTFFRPDTNITGVGLTNKIVLFQRISDVASGATTQIFSFNVGISSQGLKYELMYHGVGHATTLITGVIYLHSATCNNSIINTTSVNNAPAISITSVSTPAVGEIDIELSVNNSVDYTITCELTPCRR